MQLPGLRRERCCHIFWRRRCVSTASRYPCRWLPLPPRRQKQQARRRRQQQRRKQTPQQQPCPRMVTHSWPREQLQAQQRRRRLCDGQRMVALPAW